MRRPQQPLWVAENRKDEALGRLKPVKSTVNRKDSCLFVIDEEGHECGIPVENNCHVIPKSGVLRELMDHPSGKVLELQWGVTRWGHHFLSSNKTNPVSLATDSFEPQLIGTGDACARWFACRNHDVEFHPIDVGHLDFSNPVVPFLCLYRSTLYTADLLRMASNAATMSRRRALNSPYVEARIEWLKSKQAIESFIPWNRRILTRLGKAWHIKKAYGDVEPDIVCGQLIPFCSRVRFGACVIYRREFTVVVFPYQGDLHVMGVLHLTEDSNSVKASKEYLVQAANLSSQTSKYDVDILKELITNGLGAAAMSPESYLGLADEDKETIRQLVARSSGDKAMGRVFGR